MWGKAGGRNIKRKTHIDTQKRRMISYSSHLMLQSSFFATASFSSRHLHRHVLQRDLRWERFSHSFCVMMHTNLRNIYIQIEQKEREKVLWKESDRTSSPPPTLYIRSLSTSIEAPHSLLQKEITHTQRTQNTQDMSTQRRKRPGKEWANVINWSINLLPRNGICGPSGTWGTGGRSSSHTAGTHAARDRGVDGAWNK